MFENTDFFHILLVLLLITNVLVAIHPYTHVYSVMMYTINITSRYSRHHHHHHHHHQTVITAAILCCVIFLFSTGVNLYTSLFFCLFQYGNHHEHGRKNWRFLILEWEVLSTKRKEKKRKENSSDVFWNGILESVESPYEGISTGAGH